jgi:hypothetical protein
MRQGMNNESILMEYTLYLITRKLFVTILIEKMKCENLLNVINTQRY